MLAPKFGNFDRDIKSKLKIMSLEVDSAYHTKCSMKATLNGYGLLCASALLVLFVHHQKPIIRLRSLRAQAVYLPTNVRGPISHYRDGSVGVTAACRALCGLLCLTLWARPDRTYEVSDDRPSFIAKSCTLAQQQQP